MQELGPKVEGRRRGDKVGEEGGVERECSTLSRMVHTLLVFLDVVCSPLLFSSPPPHAVAAGQKQTYFLEGERGSSSTD